MKNKKLLTNILFAVVVLAIAAVLLAVRSHNATGGKLAAQLIYGDDNAVLDIPLDFCISHIYSWLSALVTVI